MLLHAYRQIDQTDVIDISLTLHHENSTSSRTNGWLNKSGVADAESWSEFIMARQVLVDRTMLLLLCCSERERTEVPWTTFIHLQDELHYTEGSEGGQYFHEQRFFHPSLTSRALAASPTPSSVGMISEISLQCLSTDLVQRGVLLCGNSHPPWSDIFVSNGQRHQFHNAAGWVIVDCCMGRTGLFSLRC